MIDSANSASSKGSRAGVMLKTQRTTALILGASSKLGRMLRHAWEMNPVEGIEFIWQNRAPDDRGSIVWQPGMPTGVFPPVDAIVALWGVTPGQGDLSDNTRLAHQASHLARSLGAKRVLHCSSAAVYQPGPVPCLETDTPGPAGEYGLAKLAMERAVLADYALHSDGPRPCLMRIANVVGADSLFAALEREGPVRLDQFADGKGPCRSYASISTLSRAISGLVGGALSELPAIVNVAGAAPVAMADLVRAAGSELIWQPAPDTAVPLVELSVRRLSEHISLPPNETADSLIRDWRHLRQAASEAPQ